MHTLHQIAAALDCDLSELLLDDEVHRDDALQRIPWSVSTMLRRRFSLPDEATCDRPEQVVSVLLKMRDEWKRHLRRASTKVSEQVYLQADNAFDRDIDRYLERYLDLWNGNRRTIQIATDGKYQYGLSVVLPLTKEAFHSFVKGEIELLEIKSEHLVSNSQYLLLDSVCEFSDAPNSNWYQLTSTLSYTMISQAARFSIDPLRDDFQMASFAASDLNATRLREAGFRPNGCLTPVIDCPVQVFSRVSNNRFNEQYVQTSNMSHITRLTRESWISGLNRVSKQIGFVSTLKFIKWADHCMPAVGSLSEDCGDTNSRSAALAVA